MTTATPVAALAAPRGASFGTSVLVVAQRTIKQFLRTPQIIVINIVQGVAFLLIFRYVFGGAIATGSLNYVNFMVPGLLTAGVLFAGMGGAVGVAEDQKQGFVDRLRSLPMPRTAIIAGRVVADACLLALSLAINTVVAFAVGFRIHVNWPLAVGAYVLCVFFGFAFAWVFIALGLLAGNAQAAQGIGFLVLPLTFASSAYVPVNTMPGWLQAFAEHQPVTLMINAVRTLTEGRAAEQLLGHSTGYYLTRSLIWALAIMVVFAPLAIARLRRR